MLRLAPSHRDVNSCWPSASSDRTNPSQCGRSTPGAGHHLVVGALQRVVPFEQPPRCRDAVDVGGRFHSFEVLPYTASKRHVDRRPQVERQREVRVALLGRVAHRTGRVADVEEPRQAPAFRLVRVDRKDVEVPSSGMRDVVDAAAHRALVPCVQDVEHQRRVHRNRRMQAARRLPCPIAHAGDELADRSRGMQRHAPAVARDDVARAGHAGHLDLQPLDRGIHVPNRPSGARFFAHHMPRLERLPQLEVHAAARHGAVQRETETPDAARTTSVSSPYPLRRRSARTSSKSCATKCGSMKRSCSSVPQRTSG